MNWPYVKFEIPESILEDWRKVGKRTIKEYETWKGFQGIARADKSVT